MRPGSKVTLLVNDENGPTKRHDKCFQRQPGSIERLMNSSVKAMAVVAASVAWFYGFLNLTGTKGEAFSSETTELALSMLILFVPLVLPYLGFRLVMSQPRSTSYKLVVFPSFVISLFPAVTLLCLILVLLLVPAPK
jgi:hypothetical protein